MRLMYVWEQVSVQYTCPYRHSFGQSVRHAFATSGGIDYYASVGYISEYTKNEYIQRQHLPSMSDNGLQDLQIQSSKAEAPLPIVAIGAFEIGTLHLVTGRDVPAPASFVRDEW